MNNSDTHGISLLPHDSLHHILSFCDGVGLANATSVCKEWLGIVATPSHTHSHLWASLATHAWHHAHRLHSVMEQHSSSHEQHEDPDEVAELHAEHSNTGDAADLETSATIAAARFHSSVPAPPLLFPWMPPSVGYRELLFHTTMYPTHIDSSSPALFSRTEGDLHQMIERPAPSAKEYIAALKIAQERESKRVNARKRPTAAQTQARNRRDIRRALGHGLDAGDDDADAEEDEEEEEDGGESNDDNSSDADEDSEYGDNDVEFLEGSEYGIELRLLDQPVAFIAMLREQIGDGIRQAVEAHRVHQASERRREKEQARRAAQSNAMRTTNSAAAASSTPTVSAESLAASSVSKEDPSSDTTTTVLSTRSARGRSGRAVANGPTPENVLEAEIRASAPSAVTIEDEEDIIATSSAAEEDEDNVDDVEVDGNALDEDDASEEADDWEDADEEMEDVDDFDDEDDESDEEHDDEIDESTRAEIDAHIAADTNAQSKLRALFDTAIEDISPIPRHADRVKAIEKFIQSEEANLTFEQIRLAGLMERSILQKRQQQMCQQLIRTATFDLGCLTRAVPPGEEIEQKSSTEQHLIKFAYAGVRSGGDRSVRADVVFPTRLPNHAHAGVPFTNICWITRAHWNRIHAEATHAAHQAALPTKFVKATTLLPSNAVTAASSPGSKRKHSLNDSTNNGDADISTPSRKAQRGDDDAKYDSAGGEDEEINGAVPNGIEIDECVNQFSLAQTEIANMHGEFVPVARLSLLAYFEVLIEGDRREKDESAASDSRPGRNRTSTLAPSDQCVAIGLGSARFRLAGKQPGWDIHSFGWHSDDGSIFHGSGDGMPYSEEGFSVGDVVGCGLEYDSGRIFFTKNGRHLGEAFRAVPPTDQNTNENAGGVGGGLDNSSSNINSPLPWTAPPLSLYPIIGLDAVYDITISFGDTFPFIYDVLEHEKKLMHAYWNRNTTDVTPTDAPSAAATPASPSASRAAVQKLVTDYRAFMQAKAKWREAPLQKK
jgi:hypothetical protein